jgi:integrase/recombinase XerD
MEWRSTINEFLDYLQQVKQSSANTVMAYRNDLTQFADFLSASMPAEATWPDVKPEHIDAYVAKLTSGSYTPSTTARKIAAMKTLFHWLGQDHSEKPRYVNEDPTVHLRSPKVQKRAPRLLSEEEVGRLFEAASRMPPPRSLRDRALLEVIYSTGMRVSEAISLKLGDIDFETGAVRCAGRGTRQRVAPLTLNAMNALRDYLDRARADMMGSATTDFVFLNPLGTKLTRQAVWQLTRQYAQQAGIEGELTPHTLRHSRAAHMLNSGEDIKRVQEWLGHANLATTQMYRPKVSASKETGLVPVSHTLEPMAEQPVAEQPAEQ